MSATNPMSSTEILVVLNDYSVELTRADVTQIAHGERTTKLILSTSGCEKLERLPIDEVQQFILLDKTHDSVLEIIVLDGDISFRPPAPIIYIIDHALVRDQAIEITTYHLLDSKEGKKKRDILMELCNSW